MTFNSDIGRNPLSQIEFKFILQRAPNIEFFLQRCNIPQINLPDVKQPNPFVDIPHAGDHISFGPLAIEFKVDENLKNYREIQEWLYGLGFPQENQQYADLVNSGVALDKGLKSDVSVVVNNSLKRANFEFTFKDAFPTSLSSLQFDVSHTEQVYQECLATFSFTYFTIAEI